MNHPYADVLIPLEGSICSNKAARSGLEPTALLEALLGLLPVLESDALLEPDTGKLATAWSQAKESHDRPTS